jgi:hypothetical protein
VGALDVADAVAIEMEGAPRHRSSYHSPGGGIGGRGDEGGLGRRDERTGRGSKGWERARVGGIGGVRGFGGVGRDSGGKVDAAVAAEGAVSHADGGDEGGSLEPVAADVAASAAAATAGSEEQGDDVGGRHRGQDAASGSASAKGREPEGATTLPAPATRGKTSNWHPQKATALAGALGKNTHFAAAGPKVRDPAIKGSPRVTRGNQHVSHATHSPRVRQPVSYATRGTGPTLPGCRADMHTITHLSLS